MVASVTSAASSIDALASSAEAKAAFANLNKTAADVQGLVTNLDTQVGPVSFELVRSLHSFHDAAQSVQKLVGPQSGLGDEAVKAPTIERVVAADRVGAQSEHHDRPEQQRHDEREGQGEPAQEDPPSIAPGVHHRLTETAHDLAPGALLSGPPVA